MVKLLGNSLLFWGLISKLCYVRKEQCYVLNYYYFLTHKTESFWVLESSMSYENFQCSCQKHVLIPILSELCTVLFVNLWGGSSPPLGVVCSRICAAQYPTEYLRHPLLNSRVPSLSSSLFSNASLWKLPLGLCLLRSGRLLGSG